MSDAPRGSLKHVQDWIRQPTFADELNDLLSGTGAKVDPAAKRWMPTPEDPAEARLGSNGKHWRQVFADYAKPVVPEGFIDREVPCGAASFKLIVRSRPILEESPRRELPFPAGLS